MSLWEIVWTCMEPAPGGGFTFNYELAESLIKARQFDSNNPKMYPIEDEI